MGFAENYAFPIQDEAQGYHWAHQSCTVHPVVCHYKNSENQLMISSLCFPSEALLHDVVMVHLIQKKTFQHLKKAVSQFRVCGIFQ